MSLATQPTMTSASWRRTRSYPAVPGDIGARYRPARGSDSAGGSGDEGGDDVRRVPVKGLSCPVVAHRRPGIGVTGRFLHVAKGPPRVQPRRDERVAQAVG